MDKRIIESIDLAAKSMDLDLSSVEVIFEEYRTWIGYVTINGEKAILLGQDEHHSALSFETLQKNQ